MLDSYSNPYLVAASNESVRAAFIRKTYTHLAGAILAFVAIEWALFQIPGIQETVFGLLAKSRFSWLLVLGVFMFVSHIANKWAMSSTSLSTQYLGLAIYVVAEALIFLPLLLFAAYKVGDPEVIGKAGIVTLAMFGGLTFVAFTTKKDFSFLGGMLKVGFFIAIGLIAASFFFNGLDLGIWFSGAMVLLASGSILYTTSNIIHHYRTDQYVAASLGLFASVALLFWYILQIFMSRD
ncbi:MAG: Bax inhibitor-1 family protein [Akkermansiaceae bacterium]|nr:Bax inhibitor-1 family protein [Akkermansiaceae bacterium]